MQTIYLITCEGPEWNTPIEAWGDRETADSRVKELDANLDKTSILDGLSDHCVTEIPFTGAGGSMDSEHWAELYRLRAQVKGPYGFDTWRDAAVHERQLRVAAEARIVTPELPKPRGPADPVKLAASEEHPGLWVDAFGQYYDLAYNVPKVAS